MQSSSSVREDSSLVTSSFEQYDRIIDGLSATWEGLSYNNIKSVTSDFSSVASTFLSKRLENYADACDEYEKMRENYDEYIRYKAEKKRLKRELDSMSVKERVDYPFKYQRYYKDWQSADRKCSDYQKKYKDNLSKMKSFLSKAGSGTVQESQASSTVSYSIAAFSDK